MECDNLFCDNFIACSAHSSIDSFKDSFLHMGVALKFNFLRFQIKNKSDFSNIRKVSFDPFIYGFGPYNASYNIEFSIYLYLNINLFNDEKVTRRESYLDM